ncbi:hypothetical protein [Streptomyces griseus]|uniref:hypothetical protein n=1 Tax=Streptomyces griseus TaxID=1911 RepID=UPI000AEEDA50|nr:hypothetical protein [Streptomyces griseus]
MPNTNFDRDTLRELADEGNEMALDRLADLADAAGDLGELSELLDEGSPRAGVLLTRRAVASGDLRELQRISDAGFEGAGHELDRLLKAPAAPNLAMSNSELEGDPHLAPPSGHPAHHS